MVGPIPDNLRELARFGGLIKVRCKLCGHEAHFNTGDLSNYFRQMKVRDDWHTIAAKFVCQGRSRAGCGSRKVHVRLVIEAPEPPPRKPKPVDAPKCPKGIDPVLWSNADDRERKRLVSQARS